jgi:hypothetical protein
LKYHIFGLFLIAGFGFKEKTLRPLSCLVLKIHKHGFTNASRRVDMVAGLTMVAMYVGTICF